MHPPMRVIKFSQTHRRTGARRRFIIAQFDDATGDLLPSSETETYAPSEKTLAWRYKVQLDDGVWSAFRPLDAAPDAAEQVIRMAAVRHLSGRQEKPETDPSIPGR